MTRTARSVSWSTGRPRCPSPRYCRAGSPSRPSRACSSRAARSRSTRPSGWRCCPGQGQDEPLGWRRVVDGLGLVDLDAPPEVLAAEHGRPAHLRRLRRVGHRPARGRAGRGRLVRRDPAGPDDVFSLGRRRSCGAPCCAARAATWRWCRPTSTTRPSTDPPTPSKVDHAGLRDLRKPAGQGLVNPCRSCRNRRTVGVGCCMIGLGGASG